MENTEYDVAADLKALDDALRQLPAGSVRDAADSALESMAVRLLELMTDRLVATTRPTVPPPNLGPHECVPSGDGFCPVCGKGAADAMDFRLTAVNVPTP